ncbi:L-rhamnose mutarotase [Agromyces sp. NPDC058064]|uniref:L-rhamnose mutarotase n=1 Tax=Agromyces sp. NPDC058064 TaxID=3346322 RepID=UPI0036DBAF3A
MNRADAKTPSTPARYASTIRLRPGQEAEYRQLHAAVWPEVIEQIHRSGIRNYSIFLRDGILFAYYEYVGDDHDADLAAMAQDDKTRAWWTLTGPCQLPIESAGPDEWWAAMGEVFHVD